MLGFLPRSPILITAPFEPSPLLLQMGVPGGPELLLFNLVVAYFTYRDASKRPGVNETLWAAIMGLASLLLNLIGFIIVFAVYYFVVVRD